MRYLLSIITGVSLITLLTIGCGASTNSSSQSFTLAVSGGVYGELEPCG